MTNRNPAFGRPVERPVAKSDFVESESKPITIPREVTGSIRKRVRTLLDQNPYLTQAQLSAVIRLAEMEVQYKELKEQVARDGYVIENRFGDLKKNPAAELLGETQTRMMRQEHALAISIPARKQQISKEEEKMKRGGPKPGFRKEGDGSVSPKLKIA